MFVGNVVGNVIGPEPNGLGIVVVGADDVVVPDGCGAVVVPDGGGFGVVDAVCGCVGCVGGGGVYVGGGIVLTAPVVFAVCVGVSAVIDVCGGGTVAIGPSGSSGPFSFCDK